MPSVSSRNAPINYLHNGRKNHYSQKIDCLHNFSVYCKRFECTTYFFSSTHIQWMLKYIEIFCFTFIDFAHSHNKADKLHAISIQIEFIQFHYFSLIFYCARFNEYSINEARWIRFFFFFHTATHFKHSINLSTPTHLG